MHVSENTPKVSHKLYITWHINITIGDIIHLYYEGYRISTLRVVHMISNGLPGKTP